MASLTVVLVVQHVRWLETATVREMQKDTERTLMVSVVLSLLAIVEVVS